MIRHETTRIVFRNFHERTIAHFLPHPVPDREPDFVSKFGSAYQDMTAGVIRSSDHWAGHNGYDSQASCVWSLDGDEIPPREWHSGHCL